jgi:AraC-like DNA-binding protein
MNPSPIQIDGPARMSAARETWGAHCNIPRHRHVEPYAALILAGGYEESGSFGRYRVRAGQVLLHRMFDAHLDHFHPSGACILNLRLNEEPDFGVGTVADPDTIARLAEQDPGAATAALKEQLRPCPGLAGDWPDQLAQDLRDDLACRLEAWAERHGLAPETLSRGFRKAFGATPAQFRAEARARWALSRIARGGTSLVVIAAEGGFADQAHMTRAVTTLTGQPPGYWLRSIRFKTS